jgi:hypothetical protein
MPYKGKVYDLSVKSKHSYNVQGLAVHNSGAGSLVCYALGITQVDPIKHGLLFERFLSRKKACLGIESWVLTYDSPKQLKNIVCGDKLRTHTGRYSEVVAIDKTYNRTDCCEISYGYEEKPPILQSYGYRYFYYIAGTLICSTNHKFVLAKKYQSHVQPVKQEFKDWELVTTEYMLEASSGSFKSASHEKLYGIGSDDKTWSVLEIKPTKTPQDLIDIRLAEDHTFWVSDRKDGVYVLSHNSLPDIDSDVADREVAIKILIEHFGEECVLPVSNYNQLQLKSLIKDLAKLYQIPFEIINPLTQQIERETLAKDKEADGFDRGVWFLTYESAEKNSPTFRHLLEEYPQLESSLKVLFKQIKSCFSESTMLLTDSGWKQYKDIDESKDKIAFVNTVGEIEFNGDYFKVENGEKPLYRIVLENGKEIELTEDHLVETEEGWKQVRNLTAEDKLVSWI